MKDRNQRILDAVGKRVSQCGDMHIRVSFRTLRAIGRMVGCGDWEFGWDDFREVDALALDMLRDIAQRRQS